MGKILHSTPGLFARAPFFAILVSGTIVSSVTNAWAEDAPEGPETPHENRVGMPGIVRMSLPVAAQAPIVIALTGGYGFIDPMYDLSAPGHRLQGQAAIAVSPLPYLVLGVDAWGRIDLFSSEDDDEANLYGEPRLSARLQHALSPDVHLGGELGVRFVGEEAPDIKPASISPSLRALVGARLSPSTWLAGTLGFHLDNSDNSLPPLDEIGAIDRITIGASSSFGIPFGVGISHRLASETELLGELGGEILVGSSAPPIFESPWGISVGARQPFGEQFAAMASVDVSLSARGEVEPNATVPVEPRLGGFLTLVWRPGARPPVEAEVVAVPEEKEEVVEEELPPAIPTSPVQGSVVDEGGRPLADVQVVLQREGASDVEERTYANGQFEFKEVPEGPVVLVIKTPGYDEVKVQFAEGEPREKEVILYPSLPAGQVKGEVRDLQGNPLPDTKITISPGDKTVEVTAEGTFTLELAPGRYTVRFDHPELSPQKRVIRVQDRGVVILNIALTR